MLRRGERKGKVTSDSRSSFPFLSSSFTIIIHLFPFHSPYSTLSIDWNHLFIPLQNDDTTFSIPNKNKKTSIIQLRIWDYRIQDRRIDKGKYRQAEVSEISD